MMMLETDAVFEILPIKPSDDLDQIEDIINDEILFRYHPDNITDNETFLFMEIQVNRDNDIVMILLKQIVIIIF